MAFKSGFGSGAWPAPARVLSCAPCGRPGAVALLGGQIRAASVNWDDVGWLRKRAISPNVIPEAMISGIPGCPHGEPHRVSRDDMGSKAGRPGLHLAPGCGRSRTQGLKSGPVGQGRLR